MKQRQIIFPAAKQVALVDNELPAPGPGEVLVRTEVSQMSTGTENICFNQLFAPGTHWDNWVKYPFQPGYSAIGIVEEVGPEVARLKVGDRVGHQGGHASAHVLAASRCIAVPAGLEPERAVWFTLAHITYNGARLAGFGLGDKVVVVGAGPIGQMTLRWAVACGAEDTLVIDAMANRLQMATKGGATYTLGVSVADARPDVERLFRRLADVVADATGHAAVFEKALELVRTKGRFLLIGDTGTPTDQRLTGDLLRRSITVHGAHGTTTFEDRDSDGIAQLFFKLVLSGRISLQGLNTHFFDPENAPEAYRLVNQARHQTMGVLFRWS